MTLRVTGAALRLPAFRAATPPEPRRVVGPAGGAWRQLWSGPYAIHGVVRVGPGDGVLSRRRVRLYDRISGQLVGQTWSDATTGAFSFEGLAMREYDTRADDYARVYASDEAGLVLPV